MKKLEFIAYDNDKIDPLSPPKALDKLQSVLTSAGFDCRRSSLGLYLSAQRDDIYFVVTE